MIGIGLKGLIMSRYIFIDLGAYNGDSIKEFMDLSKANDSTRFFQSPPELPVEASEFEIYAFEPNPKFFPDLAKLAEQYNIVEVHNAAAWTDEGIHDFAIDPSPDLPYGSTLMKSKKELWSKAEKSDSIVKLHTIDFSEWIKQFKDDYVIVKSDIEGAEFPVLEKMLKDGTHKIMDQLWCEFHPNKLVDYTTDYKDDLVARLRKDIKVEEWH